MRRPLYNGVTLECQQQTSKLDSSPTKYSAISPLKKSTDAADAFFFVLETFLLSLDDYLRNR